MAPCTQPLEVVQQHRPLTRLAMASRELWLLAPKGFSRMLVALPANQGYLIMEHLFYDGFAVKELTGDRWYCENYLFRFAQFPECGWHDSHRSGIGWVINAWVEPDT